MSILKKYSTIFLEQVSVFEDFYTDMLASLKRDESEITHLYEHIEEYEKTIVCEDISNDFAGWYKRRVSEVFANDAVVIHNILVRSKSYMLDKEQQEEIQKIYFALYLMGNVMLQEGVVAILDCNGKHLNKKLLPLFPNKMQSMIEVFAREFSFTPLEQYIEFAYTYNLNRMNMICAMMPVLFFSYLLEKPVNFNANRMRLCLHGLRVNKEH